jgi:rhodanese-related sulfurtransferase
MAVLAVSVGLGCATNGPSSSGGDIPRITKEQLKARLGDADLTIVDVRIPKDYDNSVRKIPGAVRENPMDVNYWSPYPKDREIVLYCA